MSIPDPPAGTKARGRKLWESVLSEYVLEEHETALLREACRTVDLLEELDAAVPGRAAARRKSASGGRGIVIAADHVDPGARRIALAGRCRRRPAAWCSASATSRWCARCLRDDGRMRRRGAGGDAPPRHLLKLDLADWPDPGPPPAWWREETAEEPWRPHRARRAWSRARRDWVRYSGGIDAVNAMYGEGFDAQEPDSRFAERERSIMLAVAVPAARRNRPSAGC